jgi:hypothetical protein
MAKYRVVRKPIYRSAGRSMQQPDGSYKVMDREETLHVGALVDDPPELLSFPDRFQAVEVIEVEKPQNAVRPRAQDPYAPAEAPNVMTVDVNQTIFEREPGTLTPEEREQVLKQRLAAVDSRYATPQGPEDVEKEKQDQAAQAKMKSAPSRHQQAEDKK